MNIIAFILELLFGGRRAKRSKGTRSMPRKQASRPTPKEAALEAIVAVATAESKRDSDQDEEVPEKLPVLPPLKRDFVTTKNECEFYHNLIRVVPGQYVVLAKVRIEDAIKVPFEFRGYYKSRHFDFLIVDRKSMFPRLVIELDDSSHKSQKAERADKLKNLVCDAAKLPLLRYAGSRFYDVETIQKALIERLPANPC